MIAIQVMMDGIITTLRKSLDLAGYEDLPLCLILPMVSSYYGLFRDVVESAPSFADRKTYQMDPANRLKLLMRA